MSAPSEVAVPVTIMVDPDDMDLLRPVLVEAGRGIAAAARDVGDPAQRRRLLALAGRVYAARGETPDEVGPSCPACGFPHDHREWGTFGGVCGRCGQHTGNSNQGHYWAHCKATGTTRDFHFCCPTECELEALAEAERALSAQAVEAGASVLLHAGLGEDDALGVCRRLLAAVQVARQEGWRSDR